MSTAAKVSFFSDTGACGRTSEANNRGTEPTSMGGTSGIPTDVVHNTLSEGF